MRIGGMLVSEEPRLRASLPLQRDGAKQKNINDLTFWASGTDIGWVSGLHTISIYRSQRKVEWRPFCKECSNANVAAERGRGILPRSRHWSYHRQQPSHHYTHSRDPAAGR